eukprot:scaffold624_cov402-Prasinococcus_capsulatus_cf.AAC.80
MPKSGCAAGGSNAYSSRPEIFDVRPSGPPVMSGVENSHTGCSCCTALVYLQSVLHARLDPDYKNRMALGAWGRRGGITGLTNDALALNDFVDSVHAEFNQSVIAGTNTSALPFIDRRMVGIYEYFRELSKYKFLIAPHGGGIQSPKFLEALMVLTIPVTKRYGCFEQLQEYGMPIVLVDEWQDITEELLRQVRAPFSHFGPWRYPAGVCKP